VVTGIAWSCPAIDRLRRTIQRHVPEPDRAAALLTLEELRALHVALRAAADGREPHGLPAVLREVERRLARYDALSEARAGEAVPDLGEHPDGLVPTANTWPPPEPTPVPPEEP
jgi:hypothetical protein